MLEERNILQYYIYKHLQLEKNKKCCGQNYTILNNLKCKTNLSAK